MRRSHRPEWACSQRYRPPPSPVTHPCRKDTVQPRQNLRAVERRGIHQGLRRRAGRRGRCRGGRQGPLPAARQYAERVQEVIRGQSSHCCARRRFQPVDRGCNRRPRGGVLALRNLERILVRARQGQQPGPFQGRRRPRQRTRRGPLADRSRSSARQAGSQARSTVAARSNRDCRSLPGNGAPA